MIRKCLENEFLSVMEIWLSENKTTHRYISASYWEMQYEKVLKAIMAADVFVEIDEESSEIRGFMGLIDDYIAGIFIKSEHQSKGYGSCLIEYAKRKYDHLSLNVYKKNDKAINFYISKGFNIISSQIDLDTNQDEYFMEYIANT